MMKLRTTESLCPVCLRRIDAAYVERDGAVFLCKSCPEHGSFEAPIWGSCVDSLSLPSFSSWSRPKSPSYPKTPQTTVQKGCPFDCGLCADHGQHTCTGLVEVTSACNMHCPLCYADAGGKNAPTDPTIAQIALRLEKLSAFSGSCNLQISGGEPTVRTDLPQIIALASRHNFGLVQLNTNGLLLAERAEYAHELAAAGLDSVYLQWDGVSEATFKALRGQPALAFKKRALENCARAGLGVVLVATVVAGINDHELGDLLRLALQFGPSVRGLHIQPAAFFGRAPWKLLQAPRLTLTDIMALLAKSAPELVSSTDFHPPGCEHELCSFSALYRRRSHNGATALELIGQSSPCCQVQPTRAEEGALASKKFTALHWRGASAQAGANFDRFLANVGVTERFTLSCMAFQDALSLDIARVRGCCIHVVQGDGRLVPFCLHNLSAENGTRLYGR